MLLPVKLHHGVIHPQQNLDVVRSLGGLSAGSPALVYASLHALIESLKIHQTAQTATCGETEKWTIVLILILIMHLIHFWFNLFFPDRLIQSHVTKKIKGRATLCCKKKDITTLATVWSVTRSFPFQADRWKTANRRRWGRSITLSTSPNQLGASSMLQLCNVSLATCSWVNQRSVQANISSPVTFLLDDNPRVRTIFIMLTLRVSITLLQDYRGKENSQ